MSRLLVAYGRLPRAVRIGAPIAWAVVIWMLSSRPGKLESVPLWRSLAFNAGHGVLFAVLAALIALSLPPRLLPGAGALLGFALAVLYGIVDELHQDTVPRRHASLLDVVTDACGALFAAAAMRSVATGDRKPLFVALAAATGVALSSLIETL